MSTSPGGLAATELRYLRLRLRVEQCCMWLVGLSKNDWVTVVLCSCQSEYRSDAAGAFSARREVHVHPPSPICVSHLDTLQRSLLLLSFYSCRYLSRSLQFLSTLNFTGNSAARPPSHRQQSAIPVTAYSHHIPEPRDLTNRAHAVATILRNPLSCHFSSPAWSSLQ